MMTPTFGVVSAVALTALTVPIEALTPPCVPSLPRAARTTSATSFNSGCVAVPTIAAHVKGHRCCSGAALPTSAPSRRGGVVAAARRDGGGRYRIQRDRMFTVTLTDILIILNIISYCFQLSSAYNAHAKIVGRYSKVGLRFPDASKLGLPWSIPQGRIRIPRGASLNTGGTFTRDFVMVPGLVRRRRQLYRMVSSSFMHGSVWQLGFNMANLKWVGKMVEVSGPFTYLGTYIISAISGNFAQFPRAGYGASGAVMGLYGFMSCKRYRYGQIEECKNILTFMAFNLLFGLANPRLGLASHVGGFVSGLAIGLFCGPTPQTRKRGGVSTDIYRSRSREKFDGDPLVPIVYILGMSLLLPETRTLCAQMVSSIAMHVSKPGALAQGALLERVKLGGVVLA